MAIFNNGVMVKIVRIIPTEKYASLNLNINSAKNSIPDWYKKSSQKIKGLEKFNLVPTNPNVTTSTYKKCTPFLDALTNGYIFSLSQDVEFMIKDDGSPYVVWRDQTQQLLTDHANNQWEGLPWPQNCHEYVFKWESKTIIKTPKGYSTLFTHPHNRFDLPFQTISGVVDTDKYNAPVQFPFFINKNFTGIIEKGTPLAQITFFKRDSWYKKNLKYDENYIKKENFKFFSKIDRSYKNQFWEKKIYE